MKTIGWHIGSDYTWAFRHIADYFIEHWPQFKHVFNERADINMVMSPVYFKKMTVDKSMFLHMDGHRFYENLGVSFDELTAGNKETTEKPRIISLIWAKDKWSWGLVYQRIHDKLSELYEFIPLEFENYREKRLFIPTLEQDYFFCQNVTQLACIRDNKKHHAIVRLGGIMNFIENDAVNYFLAEIEKCGAVIATNSKLYEIGLLANKNTFLIPNPINLKKWCPDPARVWNYKNPVIGFVGNITTKTKIKYKGYDLILRATADLGLNLNRALFNSQQIPHDEMKARFYDKIDILILPTDGEGSSNTIMEALACGVPVITTKAAGYHGENLEDMESVIFCTKTVASVTFSIKILINNPDLFDKLSINGRKFAEKHHNIDEIAPKYLAVFESVINKKPEVPPEYVKPKERIKVSNIVWAGGVWSWGAVYKDLHAKLCDEFDFLDINHPETARDIEDLHQLNHNFFCHNITQLPFITDPQKLKTIVRLGGIMNFEDSAHAGTFLEAISKCAAVIATNERLKEIGLKQNQNTYLIPNGRNLKQWKPRQGKTFNSQKPVVGFIGNILTKAKSEYKGYGLVTRVCRDMGFEIKTMAYKQNHIPNEQMQAEFWQKLDLFILPTDGEGCSNSIMEALCCGVPVITTEKAGYHGETLTDGVNVVFCEKSYGGVLSAVRRFIGNPDLFHGLSVQGRRFAEDHHDIIDISERYRNVFRRHYK